MRRISSSLLAKITIVSLAMASLAWGQDVPRLEVEVTPSGNVRIYAGAVGYGAVLRALQDKLGVPIEIPAQAEELKLDYARIEASPPDEALKKLLVGSGLGYGWVAQAHRLEKVLILAPAIPQANRNIVSTTEAELLPARRPQGGFESTSSSAQADGAVAKDQDSLPVPSAQTFPPTDAGIARSAEQSLTAPTHVTMSISEAVSAIGVPPGVSPADVGRVVTLSIAEAAGIVGMPSGALPGDVGKTTIMPLPTGPGKHP